MKVSDHENIYKQINKDGNSGKLVVLEAPTGCGKSYSVVSFLCQQALNNSGFKTFFVTDQKKNLMEKSFVNEWNRKRKSQKYSYKKIAVLRSLTDTVSLLVDDYTNKEIPMIIMKSNLEKALIKLQESFNLYNTIHNSDPDTISGWSELKKMEYEFRKSLAEVLSDLAGINFSNFNDVEVQKGIKAFLKTCPEELQRWINKIYPTIHPEDFQIFLCTTDKFIRSYTPFFKFEGELFQYSALIENSLVVFDEFDSTKTRFWNKSINDALTIKFDLIDLFDSILKGLQRVENDLPIKLNKILSEGKGYQHFLEIANKLNSEFKLSFLYKFNEMESSSYVIHTPGNTLVSLNKKRYAHFDENLKQIIVNQNEPDELNFSLMLRRVSGFIKYFNDFIVQCARRYMNFRNSHGSDLDMAITQMDAYRTIYHALRLDDRQIEGLVNILPEIKQNDKTNKISQYDPHDYHEFQKEGMSLYYFENSAAHDLETEINASFLNATAENFLLNLTKKCLVYGLSATAFAPTVLDNYDLDYLKEKLGDNFINGRKFLTKSTISEFDYVKRYHEHKIKNDSWIVGLKLTLKDSVEMALSHSRTKKISRIDIDWKKIQSLDSELQKTLNGIKCSNIKNREKEIQYFRTRYLSLFESFVYFILDKNLTSFLGLQSKLADESDEMSKVLIEKVFNGLCNELADKHESLPQLCFISTQNGQVQEMLNQALELLEKKDIRVYLLSAYASIGVGQNLQHKMSEKEKALAFNIAMPEVQRNDERMNQIDLGGMYLGDVTNIMTNLTDFKLSSDILKFVTGLEYLQDANEIGPFEVKRQMKAIQNRSPYCSHPKHTKSIPVSYTRAIIQALGRMNRTFNKVRRPLILAHSNVIKNIKYIHKDKMLFSPEFNSLMKKVDSENNILQQDYDTNVVKNNLTAYSYRDVNQLVHRLSSDEKFAEEYQKIRKLVLKYPTISNDDLKLLQSTSKRCLQYLPNSDRSISYCVDCGSINRGEIDFSSTIDFKEKTSLCVSEQESGLDILMNYKGLKQFFDSNGYATEWVPNENILNPIQYINLYRGILGEIAGKYIFEDVFGNQLRNFEKLGNNELFDYKIENNNVAIDFKNWNPSHLEDRKNALLKVQKKLNILENNENKKWRAIIINIIGENYSPVTITNDGKIMEVSALVDFNCQNSLTSEDKKLIGEFLIGN
ncbi:hypothetical protein [Companilactobacillus halodurans]|uniref:Helicase/UvrB N-terminal domain-containing protein n=1 Tax=Companilactobacillus halodurans TaxID=2584183 RepID=A0A5P0ZU52_9LACO|nr:hypothetical protein [Companilactobacillus halodurans]MQS96531.1 hypothetical protein [Companilactobacillus halodurans]